MRGGAARTFVIAVFASVAGFMVGCGGEGSPVDAADEALERLRTSPERTPLITGSVRGFVDVVALAGRQGFEGLNPDEEASVDFTGRVWFARPARFRFENVDTDERIIAIRNGPKQLSIRGDSGRLTAADDEAGSLNLLEPPGVAQTDAVTVVARGTESVAGREATRLMATVLGDTDSEEGLTSGLVVGDRIDLWVDIETGLLLRYEVVIGGTPVTGQAFEELVLGESIPPQRFALRAPPGVKVRTGS